MKFHAVVIDANILIRDYSLCGYDLQKIVKTKDFYGLQVCIPEVVRDECVGNYAKDVEAVSKEFMTASDHLDKLGLQGVMNKGTVAKRLDGARNKYARQLGAFIQDNGVVVLPYPDIEHKAVVERMYRREKPFTNENVRERGYKDFLIVESIRSYLETHAQGDVLLLTDNASDFACAKALARKDSALLPMDSQYQLPRVYVARSAAMLFSELSVNIGQPYDSEAARRFNEKLVDSVKRRFLDVDAELLFDAFSAYINVNIEPESFCCEVVHSQVQVDSESYIMEADGIIKVSFRCSFSVDNLDVAVKMVGDDFVFMNQLKERAFKERLPWRGEWAVDFTDVPFAREFLFEYIDFEYAESDAAFEREVDPMFLSLSRL